jgi:hypothetical protein
MSLVKLRINRTKTGQHLCSINVNFDQENVVFVELRINRTKTGQHLSSTNVNFDQEKFSWLKLTLV